MTYHFWKHLIRMVTIGKQTLLEAFVVVYLLSKFDCIDCTLRFRKRIYSQEKIICGSNLLEGAITNTT